MTSQNKVRLGIIGAGGISTGVHLPSLQMLDDADVVAVCDLIESRAQDAAKTFAIPSTYTDYIEMLEQEQLDAVFVLTEPDQLFRPAKVCLEAGVHVFMEKPPGITTYQAHTLLRTARAADRILQVGFNRRFIPIVEHVVKLMRERTVITQVEGRFIKHGDAAFYGGCASAFVCDTIHASDMVRWVADGIPVAAALVEGQTDDVVVNRWNAVTRFDNGVTGIVKGNYKTGGRVHTLEIHGPGGSAFVDLGFGGATCSAELLFFSGHGTQSLASAGAGSQERITLDGREIAGSDDFCVFEGFVAEDRHFLECVQTGQRPRTDIEEAVRTMEFVDFMLANTI